MIMAILFIMTIYYDYTISYTDPQQLWFSNLLFLSHPSFERVDLNYYSTLKIVFGSSSSVT